MFGSSVLITLRADKRIVRCFPGHDDGWVVMWTPSRIRRPQIFSASRRAVTSSSPWVTPTSTHNPRPIEPTTSPSTATEADDTRWISARTKRKYCVRSGDQLG